MSHVLHLHMRRVHPLARLLFAVIGAAMLGLLLIFGAVALVVLLGVGLVALAVNHWRHPHTAPTAPPPRDPRVLEGDYVVLDTPSQQR
jgi:hypothetical protein